VSDLVTLVCRLAALEEDAVFDVVLQLPGIDRVRLLDVDDVERDPIVIGAIETIERGHRPAERRSRVAAKNENDRAIAFIRGERDAPGTVLGRAQVEIGRQISLGEIAPASP